MSNTLDLLSAEIRRRTHDLDQLAGTPAAAVLQREIDALRASVDQIRDREQAQAEQRAKQARQAELVSNPMSGARLATARGEQALELYRALGPIIEGNLRGALAGSFHEAMQEAMRAAYAAERREIGILNLGSDRLLDRWDAADGVIAFDAAIPAVAESNPASVASYILDNAGSLPGSVWPMFKTVISYTKERIYDELRDGEALSRRHALMGRALARLEEGLALAALDGASWTAATTTQAQTAAGLAAALTAAEDARQPIETVLLSRGTAMSMAAQGARFESAGVRLVPVAGMASTHAYLLPRQSSARTFEVLRPAWQPAPSAAPRAAGFVAELKWLVDHAAAARVLYEAADHPAGAVKVTFS